MKNNIQILANDGIEKSAKEYLEKLGYQVLEGPVAQEQLVTFIQTNNIQVLLVRSATKVNEEILKNCPSLKLVGRAGVGVDNIDLNVAKEKGIHVFNTPNSSSRSVAELVFAHIFSLSRFLHISNREMPINGIESFNKLKKNYSNGIELQGKTIGIIGFGRIGQEVAKIALGLGMQVLVYDINTENREITWQIGDQNFTYKISISSFDNVLQKSDIITLHVPKQKNGKALLTKHEFDKMKNHVLLINTSRGGIIEENDLIEALNEGKICGAGLDVFENEPKPLQNLLVHPKISVTPHTGASTIEAQQKIGLEIIQNIEHFFTK